MVMQRSGTYFGYIFSWFFGVGRVVIDFGNHFGDIEAHFGDFGALCGGFG